MGSNLDAPPNERDHDARRTARIKTLEARQIRRAQYRSVARGAVVGLGAGLVASWVMSRAQKSLCAVMPDTDPTQETSSAKAAEALAEATQGERLSSAQRAIGGRLVHYSFGAALGAAYGGASVVVPELRAGFGTAYGAAVSLVLDEYVVVALGLAPLADRVRAVDHARGFISHLIFGASLEATQRIFWMQLSARRSNRLA